MGLGQRSPAIRSGKEQATGLDAWCRTASLRWGDELSIVDRSIGQDDRSETRSYRYVVYGLVVESQFPLQSIDKSPLRDTEPAVSISLGGADCFPAWAEDVSAASGDWIHHSVLPDGSVYLKADGVLETVVSADGRRAVCRRAAGADDRTFESNLLNFILSTSLTLLGEEPLHATVVDIGGKSIGLLGDSGAGKSTLAAFLMSRGATLVTDDMLRVLFLDGKAFAPHGPHRLKLFEETARRLLPQALAGAQRNAVSGKIMVRPASSAAAVDDPRPLAALFWLGDTELLPSPDTASSSPLTGLALAQVLIGSAMNIRFQSPDRLVRQLKFAQHLAQVLPVYSLSYARRFELLDQVAREMLERMRSLPTPATAGR